MIIPRQWGVRQEQNLKNLPHLYTSSLLSGCLGPKGIPDSSQTNSPQPLVSLGFLTVFMFFSQINNSFPPVSPEWIMCGKTKQPCVRPFQDSSKYTDSKVILLHGKALSDQSELGLSQNRNEGDWKKIHSCAFFKTPFALTISCVARVAFILASSWLGFSDAVQQCLHN